MPGIGVDRSLPRAAVYAKNSSVTCNTTLTACQLAQEDITELAIWAQVHASGGGVTPLPWSPR
jgi:hypothetical protein